MVLLLVLLLTVHQPPAVALSGRDRSSSSGGGTAHVQPHRDAMHSPAASSACSLLPVKRGGAVIGTTSLTGIKGSTPAACCAACDAHPRCVAFTLSITSDTQKECWLKDNAKNGTTCPHPTCISGTNGRKPLPTPPPCGNFSTNASCPHSRCTWANGHCGSPPPPPPPPGPCNTASEAECGVGAGPYNGSKVYCAAACAWNGSSCIDRKPAAYPMPANDSLIELAGAGSPLRKLDGTGGAPGVRISFYGDSITWVNQYEPVISKALAADSGTSELNITIHNQGINGGTAGDLERRGFSPWGHLDPSRKQTNITFAETLARDKPHVVGIQIGINDFMHFDPFASNASTIGTVYASIIATVRKTVPSAKLYMASISVDGEEIDNKNHADIEQYVCASSSSICLLSSPDSVKL